MGVAGGTSRSLALIALAAMSVAPALTTQVSATPAPGDAAPVRSAAVDPAVVPAPVAPSPVPASPAAPEDPGAVPTQAGPSIAPAAPEPVEAPVVAAPATPQPPTDPLGAALFARLADPAPLLPRLGTRERDAMRAFYALGDFRPVWIGKGAFTPAATSVIARLRAATEDGLDPAAYRIPTIGHAGAAPTDAEIADADLRLSASVALYARDARGGRIVPSTIAPLITPTLDLPTADATLARLAVAGEQAGALLQGYNPSTPGYRALKARLASLRGPTTPEGPTVQIPVGPVLKVGMSDPRVPLLRTRFGLGARSAGTLDAAPGEPTAYDAEVADAVSGFQRQRGLPVNGQLTRATIVALGTSAGSRPTGSESDLIVNMERWRWLPGDLGSDYVLVNIPEYRLKAVRGGSVRDETRVIVGKPDSPTPLFSGMMEYAVVNPSWFVPPSIMKKEFLPGLARDPSYAARRGYEVVRHGNVLSVRQPPGERNALGFIKFLFPNRHAVYLHDTPNRSLFSASKRALSHGCVRVDDPFRFADAVLPDWSSERLKRLIGRGERTIRLPEKLPVHLAYFTTAIDEDGSTRTYADIYGYDAPMRAALGLAEGGVMAVRAPHKPKRTATARDDATIRSNRPEAVRATRPVVARVRRVTPRDDADVFGEPGLWTPDLVRREPRGIW